MRPPIKELHNAGLRVVYNEDGTVEKLINTTDQRPGVHGACISVIAFCFLAW